MSSSYEECAVVERYRLTSSYAEGTLPQLHDDVLTIIFAHLTLKSLGPCLLVQKFLLSIQTDFLTSVIRYRVGGRN